MHIKLLTLCSFSGTHLYTLSYLHTLICRWNLGRDKLKVKVSSPRSNFISEVKSCPAIYVRVEYIQASQNVLVTTFLVLFNRLTSKSHKSFTLSSCLNFVFTLLLCCQHLQTFWVAKCQFYHVCYIAYKLHFFTTLQLSALQFLDAFPKLRDNGKIHSCKWKYHNTVERFSKWSEKGFICCLTIVTLQLTGTLT